MSGENQRGGNLQGSSLTASSNAFAALRNGKTAKDLLLRMVDEAQLAYIHPAVKSTTLAPSVPSVSPELPVSEKTRVWYRGIESWMQPMWRMPHLHLDRAISSRYART